MCGLGQENKKFLARRVCPKPVINLLSEIRRLCLVKSGLVMDGLSVVRFCLYRQNNQDPKRSRARFPPGPFGAAVLVGSGCWLVVCCCCCCSRCCFWWCFWQCCWQWSFFFWGYRMARLSVHICYWCCCWCWGWCGAGGRRAAPQAQEKPAALPEADKYERFRKFTIERKKPLLIMTTVATFHPALQLSIWANHHWIGSSTKKLYQHRPQIAWTANGHCVSNRFKIYKFQSL